MNQSNTMNFPHELFAAFPPSREVLLDGARLAIDDAMLRQIARADYGEMADEMLAELRPIRDHGTIPCPMHWQLLEVLQLTRWSEPDDPNPSPFARGPSGRRGHQTRLFACAALLRAATDPASGYNDEDCCYDSSLALGLASARVLGDEMNEAFGCLLTWRLTRLASRESVFFAIALLVIAARLGPGRVDDAALGKLAGWVLEEESLEQRRRPWNPANPRPKEFSVEQGFWQPLVAEIKDKAATLPAGEIRTSVELCAILLEA